MPKFRQKSVVIDAVQWFPGTTIKGVIAPDADSFDGGGDSSTQFTPYLCTPSGDYELCPGDWVITKEGDSKYLCPDAEFKADYEPISKYQHIDDLARTAYSAYGAVTEFKNFRGEPMPTYSELPEKIKEAWVAAVKSVRNG